MSEKFTKKQEAAIRSLEKAYHRLGKVGLLLFGDGDGGVVTREKDYKKHYEATRNSKPFQANDFLDYVYEEELPSCAVTIG